MVHIVLTALERFVLNALHCTPLTTWGRKKSESPDKEFNTRPSDFAIQNTLPLMVIYHNTICHKIAVTATKFLL